VFGYLLVTVAVTWPLPSWIRRAQFLWPAGDTFVKLWDQWYMGHVLTGPESLTHTSYLFHPVGLDLTFHSMSWTVALLGRMLEPVLGRVGAYNLMVLGSVFLTAYAGYLLIRTLVDSPAAAWFGGAVYSFAPYHMVHTAAHPDLAYLAPLPLTVLLVQRAIVDGRMRSIAGAGSMLALTAFTSLYVFDFTLLTLIPLTIFIASSYGRWRRPQFWRTMVLLGLVSTLLGAARLAPVLRNREALGEAIEQKFCADAAQADLLAFVVPTYSNPLFAPWESGVVSHLRRKRPAYVGLIAFALSLVSLRARAARAWLATGLLFFVLSLGTVLRFNGTAYDGVPLPAALLEWLPLVRVVGRPNFFILGFLLPLAVCSAIGFDRRLASLGRPRFRRAVALVIPVLMLVEYWNGPYRRVRRASQPYLESLRDEPGEFAIVDLPMGRRNSKEWMYLQTIHHRPIVEGMSGRTLKSAYRYIEANPLLATWQNSSETDCEMLARPEMRRAIAQLIDDGFRYVIVHTKSTGGVDTLAPLGLTPAHRDARLVAYRVADLRAACASSSAGVSGFADRGASRRATSSAQPVPTQGRGIRTRPRRDAGADRSQGANVTPSGCCPERRSPPAGEAPP
jgi:hypothetical protein